MLSAHLDEMHLVKVTRQDKVGAYHTELLDASAGRLMTFFRLQIPD